MAHRHLDSSPGTTALRPLAPTERAVPATLRRLRAPGMDLTVVGAPPLTELHLNVTPVGNEPLEFTGRRAAEMLNAWDATAVRVIAFGSVRAAAATRATLHQSLDDPELPLTWVDGAACDTRPLAGLQVHAIAGTRVTTLGDGNQSVGRQWEDANATHCVFGGISIRDTSLPRTAQARASLRMLEMELAKTGMALPHVARTWFYLDDILHWYGDFNRVRNDCFGRAGFGPGRVPASTGVSSRHPNHSAVGLAAWAIRPRDPANPVMQIVRSPKQCPAPAYGSAFSRAVEIRSPGFRQLLVSGTASIDQDGSTAHVGDIDAQIQRTMEVIEAILESRGMSLDDATRATAYFRSGLDAPRFAEWLERRELRSLPLVNTCCDICREDLLFELELDAIAVAEGSPASF